MALRILVVHNAYQHRGGEDEVVHSEIALLRAHGHAVESYSRSNDDVPNLSAPALAWQTMWSPRTSHDIAGMIAGFRPDLIHAHNTFPLISPSLYWAAAKAGVPVVQTLHNFRLACLNAIFLREGKICEDCKGRSPWRGVIRACYRNSHAASAALAGMLTLHRGLGTYRNKVTRYIALNEICRRKFIEAGLPEKRIVVKPNFVDVKAPISKPRGGFTFVGRLSNEKGIAVLAAAMKQLPNTCLRAAGEGTDAGLLDGVSGVIRLGKLPVEIANQEMSKATALIVPSICFETFGLVVIEAFACGTPVIASRIGALAELVENGKTGLLFEPGNPSDLAGKMAWALAHPQEMAAMGRNARAHYEAEFTPEVNYRQLMKIYQESLEARD